MRCMLVQCKYILVSVFRHGIAAFILEKRTHKMYVDRGPKGDDEDSFWN